jgi:hypothetical protein
MRKTGAANWCSVNVSCSEKARPHQSHSGEEFVSLYLVCQIVSENIYLFMFVDVDGSG